MIIIFRQKQSFKHPQYTREQIRDLARKNNVPRGRNTRDTLVNLKTAGIHLN